MRYTKMIAEYAMATRATAVKSHALMSPTESPGGMKLRSVVAIVPM